MSEPLKVAVVVEGPPTALSSKRLSVPCWMVLILSFRPCSRRAPLPLKQSLGHTGLDGVECIVGAVKRLRKGAVHFLALQRCPNGIS